MRIDLIERFFERVLNEEELVLFTRLLKEDKEFERQVNQYEFALNTAKDIYAPKEKVIEQDLAEKWKRRLDENRSKTIQWGKYLKIAASLLIIITIGAGYFLYPSSQVATPLVAVSEQVEMLENFNSSVRGNQRIEEIILEYQNKNYTTVIALTKETSSLSLEEQFVRARAFVQLEEYEKSIPLFEDIIEAQYIRRDEAIWNLAQIYLIQEKTKEAKVYLNMIINDNYKTSTKAEEILKMLD